MIWEGVATPSRGKYFGDKEGQCMAHNTRPTDRQELERSECELTPWDARVLRPGHGPRISPFRSGFQGWSASLTSLVPLNLSGPGGVGGRTWGRRATSSSSSLSDKPASEPYDGDARVEERWVSKERSANRERREMLGVMVGIV